MGVKLIKTGYTHHIGYRSYQQDSFGISPYEGGEQNNKGVLALIADGMGGLAGGEIISALVTATMMRSFFAAEELSSGEAMLTDALNAASARVNSLLSEPGRSDGGSTLVAVLIKNGSFDFISVGDSRICLLRAGAAALETINSPHVYAVELDEMAARGEISQEQAQSDRQRAALTSYIGMGNIEKINRSCAPIPLNAGDTLLLMSDGVFNTVSNDELVRIIRSAPPQQAAKTLEMAVLAHDNKHQDNFTAVIVEIEEGR